MSERVVLHRGDSRVVLREMPDNSIDSVVTDPPYALVSIVKRFGKDGSAPAKSNGATGVYQRASAGFMGKSWDTGETAFTVEFWSEVMRVLKPGGHVAAFGASRGYHRLACAIEDAGFEIRDSLMWVYGTGFPKSHNMDGNWEGWGTALKPAFEPIVLARKPLSEGTVAANVLRWGTGALNIDGCRVEGIEDTARPQGKDIRGGNWSGDGGRSTLTTGGGTGRWPANVVHDGSDEVVGAFPYTKSAAMKHTVEGYTGEGVTGFIRGRSGPGNQRADEGSAARFFYSAKASKADRAGSKHPTVKPVALMQWLCRLITPPGGTVLDPFAGSGTTGQAAIVEGFKAILIEREPEYQADIARRLEQGTPKQEGLFA